MVSSDMVSFCLTDCIIGFSFTAVCVVFQLLCIKLIIMVTVQINRKTAAIIIQKRHQNFVSKYCGCFGINLKC